jgi:hypothetical protein
MAREQINPPQIRGPHRFITRAEQPFVWITHVEGVNDIPLMYGKPVKDASIIIDSHERVFMNDLEINPNPSDQASRYYNSVLSDQCAARELWAEFALFEVRERNQVDRVSGWRRWEMTLISAEVKTKSAAMQEAVQQKELATLY